MPANTPNLNLPSYYYYDPLDVQDLNNITNKLDVMWTHWVSLPTCGSSTYGYSYNDYGGNFSTKCYACWCAGQQYFQNTTNQGNNTVFWDPYLSNAGSFSWCVQPVANYVQVTFTNGANVYVYPRLYIVAMGY